MAAKRKASAPSASIDEATDSVTLPDATAQFEDIVRVALMTPLGNPHTTTCKWGLPCIFWGLSGLGKSEKIQQAAATCALNLNTIFPGQHAPEDFSGIPVPNGKGDIVTYAGLPGVTQMNAKGEGVLFVDEASGAPPAVQGAMLGLINDRRIGDVELANGIRILMAANPPSYSAGGWKLEAPTANRMAHFKVGAPTVTEWTEWLTGHGISDPVSLLVNKQEMLGNWNAVNSHVKGLFAGFMRGKQTLLHSQPLADHPRAGYCWPSPRTWFFASRALATVRSLRMDPTLESIFIHACVGDGPSGEFLTWVKKADLPTPEQVLIKGWEVNTDRLDITLAVSTSVASYVVGLPAGEEKLSMAAAAWRFIMNVIDAKHADVSLPAAQALSRAKLSISGHTNQDLREAAKGPIRWYSKQGMLKYVTGSIDD